MAIVYMTSNADARRAAESQLVQKLGQYGVQADQLP